MRPWLVCTIRAALAFPACFALACGDAETTGGGGAGDDDDGIAAGPDDPPLTAEDCPGTPQSLQLTPIAPFYFGLMQLTFTMAGKGTVGYQDVQLFDPALAVWTSVGGGASQREDGSFVLYVNPPVNEHNKDGGFKVRVRSQLNGCAPSEWAETEAFSLTDPFVDTTWVTELGPTDYYDYVSFGINAGTGHATGPYQLDESAPPRHELTFHADGTVDEKLSFAIRSATAGDVFAGCAFQLAFTGTWEAEYEGGARMRLSPRKLASTAGSTCTNPPLAEIQLTSQPVEVDGFVADTYSLSYEELLYSPPGKPRWRGPQFLQSFSQIFGYLNDSVGEETSYASGSVNVQSPTYEKQ